MYRLLDPCYGGGIEVAHRLAIKTDICLSRQELVDKCYINESKGGSIQVTLNYVARHGLTNNSPNRQVQLQNLWDSLKKLKIKIEYVSEVLNYILIILLLFFNKNGREKNILSMMLSI
jgi:hypothetical protein